MKLIELYEEWIKTGKIHEREDSNGFGGLCNAVPIEYKETLMLFEPDGDDWSTYWGVKGDELENDWGYKYYNFNPLRQAVVLMICAIHNEL